jgi:hypothetical protein
VEGDAVSVAKQTTTVDLVVRLQVVGSPAEVAQYRAALECLADVMRVQAEDGLWSLGHEEAETDDGPSEHVADIETALVHAVLIEGADALTKGDD